MKLFLAKSESASGKKIVLDDMILTKSMPTTAGSKMLEGYMSLFDASVISKLEECGYSVAGKANVGEMAIDLLGETSYFGACTDSEGNLSSAAAEIIKAGEAEAAICMDVNGYPRRSAAVSGLMFLKPTYGTVSRFGTIPGACSGEAVGAMAKTADECRKVICAISGHDDKDGTSLPEAECALLKCSAERDSIKKIAIVKDLCDKADDKVKALIADAKAKAEKAGIEVVEIEAGELLAAKTAWNILMSAEVCNNVSKYDGVKYGYRTPNYTNIDELYTNSRTESFGYLLKSTVLFGSETLSEDNYMKVYDKALRIRRVIVEAFGKIFENADAVLIPACSKTAYSPADADSNTYIAHEESLFTAPALITGLPALVSGGVQFVGKAFGENSLLDMAALLEKEGE